MDKDYAARMNSELIDYRYGFLKLVGEVQLKTARFLYHTGKTLADIAFVLEVDEQRVRLLLKEELELEKSIGI